jgi:hypothetical protein
MQITSSAFDNNSPIPSKYTCDGEDINPPLSFSDVPEAAKSLVLFVDDPDAPGKIFVHWVLYNISPNVKFIAEDDKPGTAAVGVNSAGENLYVGPCPPSGTHRYFFKLYALDARLEDLPDFADLDIVEEAMQGSILAQAELIGLYSSKK